jgi:Ala-tRNA(Pro) deacylase
MSISTKLKEHLDREGVPYSHHIHADAYTTQEVAAAAHVPGREMLKSVILKADDKLVMAVLSANQIANLDILKEEIGCQTLRLATEDEFREAFPTCHVGAMPPFGNIFSVPTYCELTLDRNRDVEFNAGSHHDTIRMSFADFRRLANPQFVHFTEPYRTYPQRLAA